LPSRNNSWRNWIELGEDMSDRPGAFRGTAIKGGMIDRPDGRNLVTIETVGDVFPIKGADSIEVVTVRGWRVVTKIGEFRPGDRCVYFEIDSLLPLDDARFAFLTPRGTKEVKGRAYHRLKTARLRGVYSQGLVMPVTDFTELAEYRPVGLAERLGVIKYEPPAVLSGGEIIGVFPERLGRKTDSERAQNLVEVWDEIVAGGPWVATEKIDGTSMSVFRDNAGVLHVCGRNYEIADGANLYWRTVRSYEIDALLEPGEGVQGELFGEGIQKNPLRMNGVHLAIFNFLRDGGPVGRRSWPDWTKRLAVPELPLTLPTDPDVAVAQAERVQSQFSHGRGLLAEGVVWHQADGHCLDVLDGRSTFKVISNRYLVKHDG